MDQNSEFFRHVLEADEDSAGLGGGMVRSRYATNRTFSSGGYYSWEYDQRYKVPRGSEKAKLVSSSIEAAPDLHAPCLDLDYGATLVPSSTPGHFHLYLNKAIAWRDYKRVLRALSKAGLIEADWAAASIQQQATFLRLPGEAK